MQLEIKTQGVDFLVSRAPQPKTTTTAGLPARQELTEIDTVAGGVLVERADHVTDSFRFTVASPQCGATEGNTATRPSRASGGNRSHATNSPTSSNRTCVR
jgi:hypothetical protein